MIHELKIRTKPLNDIKNRGKNFEVRYDDRNYNVGDTLHLMEINDSGLYTGESLDKIIKYIHFGLGMEKGYVVLAIGDIE